MWSVRVIVLNLKMRRIMRDILQVNWFWFLENSHSRIPGKQKTKSYLIKNKNLISNSPKDEKDDKQTVNESYSLKIVFSPNLKEIKRGLFSFSKNKDRLPKK